MSSSYVENTEGIENYTREEQTGTRQSPVWRYTDTDGELHRIDGPALVNSQSSYLYLHGTRYFNIDDFNAAVEMLSVQKKIQEYLD